jgi:dipeptidyl aminopeptidase/acylaminoacyl peptidase
MEGLPLKAVPIGGGATLTIATTLVRNAWVRPSPDGAGLLVVGSVGRTVTDKRGLAVCTAPDSCRPLGPGDDVQTLDPAWSPGSKRIAFVREAHGSYTPPIGRDATPLDYWGPKYRTRKLWNVNADGSEAREIAAAGGGVADPQFSPDGRSIVFVRDAQLWQLDLETQRVSALSGSIRSAGSCNIETCLPDAQPYETTSLWSDSFAVKFPSVSP